MAFYPRSLPDKLSESGHLQLWARAAAGCDMKTTGLRLMGADIACTAWAIVIGLVSCVRYVGDGRWDRGLAGVEARERPLVSIDSLWTTESTPATANCGAARSARSYTVSECISPGQPEPRTAVARKCAVLACPAI